MSVEIRDLTFSYGEKIIFGGLNLSVKTGESVGVVGVSGGGKSTLLKLVSGLYEQTGGEIRVMSESTPAGRRSAVSMVMQSAALFPASIRDNITCGHDMPEAEILRACEAAQLTGWIAALPDGLDSFVGERGGKVSGGQAQRIAIARAIAKNAPVVLLDEPTSALDNETSAALLSAFKSLTEGKTVLHVSHRPETLADCGRVLKLENGKLNVS